MDHDAARPHDDVSLAEVIEGGAVRKEPQYLADLWTDRAVKFVEENRARPFFLFLAYNGPYGLGPSLLEPARNRHANYYASRELPSFPREPAHPWLRTNKEYLNDPRAIRRYAAEVSAIDDGVGRVLERLRDLGLDRDTVVIFTADQGWAGGQHGIWGMGDHTRPLTGFDEELQTPMIWRHPRRILAGRTSDHLVSNYDFLPTLLSHLVRKDLVPSRPPLPGRDLTPALRGETIPGDQEVFFEFENTRSIRTAEWKYVARRFPQGPDELYDFRTDAGETRNIVEDPSRTATRDALARRLGQFFDRYADPQYDLWRGGRSKVRRATTP